jgi:hypothetical protein
MKNIYNFIRLLTAIVLCSSLYVSCKVDPKTLSADRLFRPIVTTASYSGTTIDLTWDRYTGAKTYQLEISVDSFKTILQSVRTDTTRYTFTNLNYDTKYQLHVRSIGAITLSATSDTIKSLFYTLPDVTTLDYPTYLIAPTSSDVVDNAIRVNWTISANSYTRIDVLKGTTLVTSANLTAADNTAGSKVISGLTPATTYIVKIYNGIAYMGKKTFTTAAAQIFTGDVVDLRGFTDAKALTLITQAYVDSLSLAHPAGFNLILSGGTTYGVGTISITVPMNVVTGLSFKGKAVMAMDGNFVVPAKTVDAIRFEKIYFSEGLTKNRVTSYGANYLFNFNVAGAILNSLTLENCDLKYKRGGIRLQTTATINAITLNKCLVDSINDYGVINNGNAASYIKDIVVTNSTFSHCTKLFVGGQTLGIRSLDMEFCTTYFVPQAVGNYFFDYNTNTVPGGITVKSSLFGAGSAATSNGMRSSCVSINITNCYKANDLTWTLNTAGTAPNAPINDFINMTKTTAQIFADPINGNLKVTDPLLVGKAGDPRWW